MIFQCCASAASDWPREISNCRFNFIVSSFLYDFQNTVSFHVTKNVTYWIYTFFNLTAAINRLYATRLLISESLSVFIIEGFSPCLKRLIPLHPGCQGCLNFSKLSPPLFSQHWQKKAITKIAAIFFSPFPSTVPLCSLLCPLYTGV